LNVIAASLTQRRIGARKPQDLQGEMPVLGKGSPGL
jgi:hypothetical protein